MQPSGSTSHDAYSLVSTWKKDCKALVDQEYKGETYKPSIGSDGHLTTFTKGTGTFRSRNVAPLKEAFIALSLQADDMAHKRAKLPPRLLRDQNISALDEQSMLQINRQKLEEEADAMVDMPLDQLEHKLDDLLACTGARMVKTHLYLDELFNDLAQGTPSRLDDPTNFKSDMNELYKGFVFSFGQESPLGEIAEANHQAQCFAFTSAIDSWLENKKSALSELSLRDHDRPVMRYGYRSLKQQTDDYTNDLEKKAGFKKGIKQPPALPLFTPPGSPGQLPRDNTSTVKHPEPIQPIFTMPEEPPFSEELAPSSAKKVALQPKEVSTPPPVEPKAKKTAVDKMQGVSNDEATQRLSTLLSKPALDIDWSKAMTELEAGANPFSYFEEGRSLAPNVLFKVIRDITNNAHIKGKPDPSREVRLNFLKAILQMPGAESAMCVIDSSWFGNTPFTAAIAARDKDVANIMLETCVSVHPNLKALITSPNISTIPGMLGNNSPLVLAMKTNNEDLACKLVRHYSPDQLREPCTWAGNSALTLAHIGRFNKLLPLIAEKSGSYPAEEAAYLDALYNAEKPTYKDDLKTQSNWHDMYDNDMYLDDNGRFVEHQHRHKRPELYQASAHLKQPSLPPSTVLEIQPAKTPGFMNSGNRCFANASLKQLIIGMDHSTVQQIREQAKGMIKERAAAVNAFADLAEAVTQVRQGKAAPSGRIDQLHTDFFAKAQALAAAKPTAQWEQVDKDVADLMKRLLPWLGQPQQDAHEFATGMVNLLGLNDPIHQLALLRQNKSLMSDDESERLGSAHTYFPVEARKNQNLPQSFGYTREVIDDYRWHDAYEAQTEIINRVSSPDPAALKSLKVQCKVYGPDPELMAQGFFQSRKLILESRAMLGNPPVFNMPIYNTRTHQEENHSFRIKSIVVHLDGPTLESGHYVTLEQHEGKWFKHEDSDVSELPDGIQGFLNRKPDAVPYLFDLERADL
ncbi:ubiquitin carboxyl-terminal hydrolase family protein [Endozoicomonas arenosclerae]|uniref:ubiquitin carboxyl-terminal hydrolase family protein n=1 Tax=Endozoicomonas arenosclerae TaxID=1633495 RepID=UPI000782FB52|nr:ubiquitin carboxyl-terminal hydrolase family protein [Endozoicomonas arenosclerae]